MALGYAIQIRDGEYWPLAINYIGCGLALCTAGVVLARLGNRWRGEGWVLATLFAALLMQFAMLLHFSPGGANWWSNDLSDTSVSGFRFYNITLRIAWVAVLLSMCRPREWGRFIFPIVLACHLALGVWMVRSSPQPAIDVFAFQQQAAKALLHGQNPYAIDYPDIYVSSGQDHRSVYGKDLVKNGRVEFGFPYTPLSLLLSTAGYAVFGDYRYAQVIAYALAGALIAYCRRGRVPMLAAALLLFTPRGFFILGRGWTEPFVVLGLASVTFVACRRERLAAPAGALKWLLPIVLGLFLATKQYLALALPAVSLLVPRPISLRGVIRILLPALLVACAVTLPLALWNPRAFFYSTVTVQQVAPFREDALSFLVWYAHRIGIHPGPSAVGVAFALTLGAILLSLWRASRNPAGFAAAVALIFFTFIAFNKQAFANYYFLVLGALCCAIATTGCEAKSGGGPLTKRQAA